MSAIRTKINQGIANTVNAELGTDVTVTMLTAAAPNGQPRFSIGGDKDQVEAAATWLVEKGLMSVEEVDDYEDPQDPGYRAWRMVAK